MYYAKAICFADLPSLREGHEKKCFWNVLLVFVCRKTYTVLVFFNVKKNLWVRIKGQTRRGDTIVSVCCRPWEQEEEVDEAFYRQLEAASKSQALALVGDLSTLTSAGEVTQSREALGVQQVPGKH